MTEEKNELKEKAFEIVNEIKRTDNIFLPKNAELKGKLIAELKRIVPIDIQEKVKKTLNRPILFVGDVCKSMLAGCYAHCVRKVEFTLTLLPKRLDVFSIKHFGNPVENFEMIRQTTKDLSEIEGEFIFKDCFGQPLEKLWHGDDPDYCHASILNPNRNVYTQNTGIKNWLKDYRLGKTLFLVCLEGEDSNECKEFVKNIREMSYPKPGIPNKLIVHTNDINKLPEYFLEPFEEIPLELEKQDKTVDILQAKTKSEDSNIKNKPLFFDDHSCFLWLSYSNKTKLEPGDGKVLKIMIDIIKSKQQISCRKEEIILAAYGTEVRTQQKLSKETGTKLNSTTSTINAKCKELGIEKLIVSDGVRMLKFSRNIEIRKL